MKSFWVLGWLMLIPVVAFAREEAEALTAATAEAEPEAETEAETEADSADETEAASDTSPVSFSVENASEFAVHGDLENETLATVAYSRQLSEQMTVGVHLESYTDLLEDCSSSLTDADGEPQPHYNSAYLAEERLGAFADMVFAPTDFFELYGSLGLELNARPDDYEKAYRLGAGALVGLSFDFSDAFVSFSAENKIMPVFGLGKEEASNTLLLNDFVFDFRFDVFNFIRPDLNLGFYCLSELSTEHYWGGSGKSDGIPLLIDHEFFAGLVYTPVDFFECSFAFAMFNYTENDPVSKAEAVPGTTELGLRLAVDFALDSVTVGMGYRPHLGEPGNKAFEIAHVFDVGVSIEL